MPRNGDLAVAVRPRYPRRRRRPPRQRLLRARRLRRRPQGRRSRRVTEQCGGRGPRPHQPDGRANEREPGAPRAPARHRHRQRPHPPGLPARTSPRRDECSQTTHKASSPYKSLRVSLRSSSAAHACDRFRRDSAARTVAPADHISGVSPAPIPRRPSRACCRLLRNARIAGPRRPLRPRERKPGARSIPCALRTRTRRPRPLDPLGARSGICGEGGSATRASSSVQLCSPSC